MTRQTRYPDLGERGFCYRMETEVEPYLAQRCRYRDLRSFDGTRLRCRAYQADAARADVLIVHGFSEFAEKYNELIYCLLCAGYSVYTMDLRGHGSSERRTGDVCKVHVKDFSEYIRDIRLLFRTEVQPHRRPHFLFGHSMGGALTALYVELFPHDFTGAILSAPMLRMQTSGLPYRFTGWCAGVMVRLGQGERYAASQHAFPETHSFAQSGCRSRERYAYTFGKRAADPNFQTWGATHSWLYAACRASMRATSPEAMRRIAIPLLVFSAEKDGMVDTPAIQRFAAHVPSARYVPIRHAKHELLNGDRLGRAILYRQLFAFLDRESRAWAEKNGG